MSQQVALKETRGSGVVIRTIAHVDDERALIVETTKQGNCEEHPSNVVCLNEANLIALLDSIRNQKEE